MPIFLCVILLLYAALISPVQAGDKPVRAIYAEQPGYDFSKSYIHAVMELALRKSGQPFTLAPSRYGVMSEPRERLFIEDGNGEVTFGVYGTSRELETRLRPIRIPLARGLMGHRLMFIHRKAQYRFSQIRSIADLRALVAVQGVGWSDVEILNHAGLKVETSRIDNLARMVAEKRVDYFPRATVEVFTEMDIYGPDLPDLAIERDLVLIYPFATFFFVNKDDTALHDAIHNGLKAAYDDGSFIDLFESHPNHTSALTSANLDGRRRLLIANPTITAETLAVPDRYWITSPSKLMQTTQKVAEPRSPASN